MQTEIWDISVVFCSIIKIRKFKQDENLIWNVILKVLGSTTMLGQISNTFYPKYGTNFHQEIICSVTNGYCKIFINLSAYKNCEFLIQSSIWLLNFILSLPCSLGMWLQSKLKSNHMWITFPHECNDFRRLINVKQCLSYLMHTFPGEMCKIAVVSWFNFLSLVVQWEMLNRNQFSAFIRSVYAHFFCPPKHHLQNAISVSLWLRARPQRLCSSCTLHSSQENSLHLDRTTQLLHRARDTYVSAY